MNAEEDVGIGGSALSPAEPVKAEEKEEEEEEEEENAGATRLSPERYCDDEISPREVEEEIEEEETVEVE